ncbi:MAG TPA: M48 family metalloprotease [Azospira sp.]|nr:M48 family metalloprotease [Azospira sp.]
MNFAPRIQPSRPRRVRRGALFSMLLAALLGAMPPVLADGLPDLGDASQSDISPQLEKKVGESILNDIRLHDPQYLDDPEVTAYIEQVGSRLAAASPDPGFGFTFFALKDPTINAFATFGGYVGVNTGLITAAQSESEMAGVLAHELSHVTQHHLARGIAKEKQNSVVAMAAMALALLAASKNPDAASAAIVGSQAAMVQSQLGFSRDFEREADRIGFQTLEKAGFDVRGMGDFFQRLQQASRLYENNAPAYMRTHPLTVERISDMQNRAQKSPYKQVPDSLEFHLVRGKLRAQLGTPKEAVADLEHLLKERKFANEAGIRFGLAHAQLRAKNYPAVEQEIQALRRLKVNSPMLDNLAALNRLDQGDAAGAAALYKTALKTTPFAKALMYGYPEALLADKRPAEALAYLDSQLQLYASDYKLWGLKAKTASALGRRLHQHQALAESYALQGQLLPAIDQLQMAQRAGDGNFYELSVVDARLRELRIRQDEEAKQRR